MWRVVAAVAVALSWPVAASAGEVNTQMIERVEAGEVDEANAAWWGFDEADATDALQSAIDSGASRVIVPDQGVPWVVEPIFLASDQEIVFEEGVVVMAKEGAFHGVADCLFTARDVENLTLRGEGATLRMRKADYQSDAYESAEWRHTLGLFGSSNVVVEGLRFEASGGDGIYIGSGTWRRPGYGPFEDKPSYCKDITIRNVIAEDNHRQGISVISVENLLIEDAVLRSTAGTAPQAGIDLEPNSPGGRLKDVVLRNVVSEGNRGAGFFIHISSLDHTSEPVTVRLEDCVARDNQGTGFSFHGPGGDEPLDGLIEFVNFRVTDHPGRAINIREKPAESIFVRFVDSTFSNVAHGGGYPIWFQVRGEGWFQGERSGETQDQGGIEFVDCVLEDDQDRPFMGFVSQGDVTVDVRDVRGNIEVRNPYGARMRIDPNTRDFELEVEEVR